MTPRRPRPVLVGAILALTLLVVLVFWFGRACFGGWWIVDSAPTADTYMVATLYERWAVQVKAGHLPLWFPEFGAGIPVHAAWMYGLFYPPLLLFTVMPPEAAWTWLAILHVILGALGAYAFLWDERRDEFAAAAGAVVFGCSGFMLGRPLCGHLNLVMPFAWAPWALLFAAKTARGERGAWARLALCTGLGLLAGHVQTWFYVAPVVAGYAVFEALRRRATAKAAQRLAFAVVLALGIAAIQWIPAAELYDVSGHPHEIDKLVRACSATPGALLRQVAPRIAPPLDLVAYDKGINDPAGPPPEIVAEWFRHEFLGLAGPLAVVAALLAFRPRDPKRWFWFAVFAFGLFLALGVRNPVSGWFADDCPPFKWARAPGRALSMTVLAGAVLAGNLVADWTVGVATKIRAAVPAAFLASALVFGVAPPDVLRPAFLEQDWTARFPETKEGKRVLVQNQRWPYLETFGGKTTRLMVPVDTKGAALLVTAKAPIVAWWLNVVAQITPTWTGAPDDAAGIAALNDAKIRRFETPSEIQRFTVATPASDADAIARLRAGEKGALFVPEDEPPAPGDPAPQAVRVEEPAPDRVDVIAERPFAGWVLVPDKWYPGWRVENADAASHVTRGQLALLAVRMDPKDGAVVHLVYRPRWLWPALLASVASLVAAAALSLLRRPGERFRVRGTLLPEAYSSPSGATPISGTLTILDDRLRLGLVEIPFAKITELKVEPPRVYVEWDSGGGVLSGLDVTLVDVGDAPWLVKAAARATGEGLRR